jgi:hypothetical protein
MAADTAAFPFLEGICDKQDHIYWSIRDCVD